MRSDAPAAIEDDPRDARMGSGTPASTPPEGARASAGRHARRVRYGLRKPGNWLQLVQFSIVGASGYVVNLTVFSLLVEVAGIHYIPAAVLAFCVAVTNNFLLNRHWTFKAAEGHAGFQAARFLTVSLVALGFNLIVLELLVTGAEMEKIPAQAIAIVAATPLNFVGNKLWSFGRAGDGQTQRAPGVQEPAPAPRP